MPDLDRDLVALEGTVQDEVQVHVQVHVKRRSPRV